MSALAALGDRLERSVPLARHTSLRVGGPARYFVAAEEPRICIRALAAARAGVAVLVIGGGSNLLIADGGFDGLVVKYAATGFEVVDGGDGTGVLVAAAGAPVGNLARRLARQGWGGLEWGATVPGTIGGAAVNNAGAFDSSMANTLIDLDLVTAGGEPRTLTNADLRYEYRASVLKRGELGPILVTSVRCAVRRVDPIQASSRIVEQQATRSATQPRQLSAGSIFANPPGDYAGRLVEAAGLKGERCGGAEISGHHANFIVNTGGATATDVYCLLHRAQQTVWERFGVWLRPEVQLVGAWRQELLAALDGPDGEPGRRAG
ncbi:MAG: UDP-N-acetylmuramate dehydrogenase [Chloroflexota bacterium]|nr:UDP-N-acetylmuramate dehydrogenase [Chloroflexota bacterium]